MLCDGSPSKPTQRLMQCLGNIYIKEDSSFTWNSNVPGHPVLSFAVSGIPSPHQSASLQTCWRWGRSWGFQNLACSASLDLLLGVGASQTPGVFPRLPISPHLERIYFFRIHLLPPAPLLVSAHVRSALIDLVHWCLGAGGSITQAHFAFLPQTISPA